LQVCYQIGITISGTAEPGSLITMTITLSTSNQLAASLAAAELPLVYGTTTGPDGIWSINLAEDTPASGSLTGDGLESGTYLMHVTATDTEGRSSAPVTSILVIERRSTAGSGTVYLPLIVR
jgi:hypothetical protein